MRRLMTEARTRFLEGGQMNRFAPLCLLLLAACTGTPAEPVALAETIGSPALLQRPNPSPMKANTPPMKQGMVPNSAKVGVKNVEEWITPSWLDRMFWDRETDDSLSYAFVSADTLALATRVSGDSAFMLPLSPTAAAEVTLTATDPHGQAASHVWRVKVVRGEPGIPPGAVSSSEEDEEDHGEGNGEGDGEDEGDEGNVVTVISPPPPPPPPVSAAATHESVVDTITLGSNNRGSQGRSSFTLENGQSATVVLSGLTPHDYYELTLGGGIQYVSGTPRGTPRAPRQYVNVDPQSGFRTPQWTLCGIAAASTPADGSGTASITFTANLSGYSGSSLGFTVYASLVGGSTAQSQPSWC